MGVDVQLEMLETEEHLAMALQAGLALRTSNCGFSVITLSFLASDWRAYSVSIFYPFLKQALGCWSGPFLSSSRVISGFKSLLSQALSGSKAKVKPEPSMGHRSRLDTQSTSEASLVGNY